MTIFLVSKNRDVLLHAADYTHVHTTHILLQPSRVNRRVGFSLARYRLAAPISEASILIFRSLETTLSFLMKVELEWALLFLGTGHIAWEMACSPNSPVIFFQLGTVHEVRCPIFWNFWLLLWLLLFLLACVVLAMGCCTLLWCCFFPSFFKGREHVMIGRWSFCFDSPIGKEIRRASITCNGINFTFFLFALVAAFMLITFFLYILRHVCGWA